MRAIVAFGVVAALAVGTWIVATQPHDVGEDFGVATFDVRIEYVRQPTFHEGAVPFVRLSRGPTNVVFEDRMRHVDSGWTYHAIVRPDDYIFESYHRSCDASCAFLDPWHEIACSVPIRVAAGSSTRATVVVNGIEGCTIDVTS